MAVSLGPFPRFMIGKARVPKLLSPATMAAAPSLRLGPQPANVRVRGMAISAAASKPASAATGKGELRGIMKPRRVTREMQDIVGVPEIPRTQALKQIWAYIKEHNLQDPNDKKVIVCDEKLKNIFGGKDRVGFLEIAGLITPHFIK